MSSVVVRSANERRFAEGRAIISDSQSLRVVLVQFAFLEKIGYTHPVLIWHSLAIISLVFWMLTPPHVRYFKMSRVNPSDCYVRITTPQALS